MRGRAAFLYFTFHRGIGAACGHTHPGVNRAPPPAETPCRSQPAAHIVICVAGCQRPPEFTRWRPTASQHDHLSKRSTTRAGVVIYPAFPGSRPERFPALLSDRASPPSERCAGVAAGWCEFVGVVDLAAPERVATSCEGCRLEFHGARGFFAPARSLTGHRDSQLSHVRIEPRSLQTTFGFRG